MKRFLVWSAIVFPPTLLILLSLKPLEIFALRFFGLFAAAFLAALIVALMAMPAFESQKRFRRQAAVSLIMVVSIITVNWPLRIAYGFSRPAFDQVAAQVITGETIAAPQRIGWFRIERVDAPGLAANGIDYQGLRLWTGVHPNGNTGFVQASPDNLKFNLWSHFSLDQTWQFIAED
ncbi:hypothetical protein N836_22290 [Leptolyngbya sp. Heron Island J]|uniref:hypothetical protein n=1 Tax=Leptolyngbya sp. Heron Island J TaxID=1385935 RepID=UPI0003B9E7F8|nr:hypothetical protein [Leptolyngbya sp. Heron Island J]ESA33123.1 hypothetical protein N836_22290 [Leptolyngbya sp. Heron Island J]